MYISNQRHHTQSSVVFADLDEVQSVINYILLISEKPDKMI